MKQTKIINIILVAAAAAGAARAYDEYSSACMRPGGRSPKAWPEPPCDFKNQAWCTAPGSAYPWHAVRRFVHENQGLMRRMYGDMRQISVLRAEYESNDVLYPGDGADFQLIRDGVNKRYRPVANSVAAAAVESPRSTSTTTRSPSTTSSRARSTTTTTTTSTSTTTSTTSTTTPSTTTRGVTSTTPTSTSTASSSMMASTSSSSSSSNTEPSTSERTEETAETEGSTTPGPDTTVLEDKELLEELLMPEEAFTTTEEGPEDQMTAESELEYEEEEEEEEVAEEPSLEKVQTPQMLRRGINACPVKEEVVAPFWANNTRGEILALLNLYPFEQYVHWEKCTDEHQQMFCRDGCRCEQQYRLHRLLAYDPRNECRGIFSDWFKFPSCCVCKCYDIPLEFRLTSRSPRRGTGKGKKVGVKTKTQLAEEAAAAAATAAVVREPPIAEQEVVSIPINGAETASSIHEMARVPILEMGPQNVPINGMEHRAGGGSRRDDLQAVVHHSEPRRPGRGFAESATIGPVDAATPHFYYQPPLAGLLNRQPRNV